MLVAQSTPAIIVNPDELVRLHVDGLTGDAPRVIHGHDTGPMFGLTLDWDNTHSRGHADVMPMSSDILMLTGHVEIGEAHRHQIPAEGWTVFAFIPGRPPGGFISAADHRPAACLRITRGTSPSRVYDKDGAWDVVMCLVRDAWLESFTSELARGLGETLADDLVQGEAFYYLPPTLRTIALAAVSERAPSGPSLIYRSSKCFELLHETMTLMLTGGLTPMGLRTSLSMADSEKVMEARKIIAEQFRTPISLQSLSRACGLNRGKLTRGFKEIFDSTISETLTKERLEWAAHALKTSDRPVSRVAYDAGYLNNASFARAFGRWFGDSPSQFRRDARGDAERPSADGDATKRAAA